MINAIMPSRISELTNAWLGLDSTGIPLLGINSSGQLYAVGFTDDLGSYMVIPALSHVIGIDVPTTAYLFYTTVVIACGLIYYGGWKKLSTLYPPTKNLVSHLLSLILLLLIGLRSDTYVFNALTAAVLPWVIWWIISEKKTIPILSGVFILIFGFIIGWAQYFRSNSGSGIIFFISIYMFILFWKRLVNKTIIFVFIVGVSGYILSNYLARQIIHNRNEYLLAHNLVSPNDLLTGHPFWHTTYIGLGYLKNSFGLRYDDQIAIDKVKSISPTAKFCSPEYERILRDSYFDFIKEHPIYFIKTYAIKFMVLILICLMFFILAGGKFILPGHLLFWPSLGIIFFSLLPALVAVPRFNYISGLLLVVICLAQIFRTSEPTKF